MSEFWDVYDITRCKNGKLCRRDYDVLGYGEYHLAALVWIIDRHGRALLQRRALGKKSYPGYWSITGGSVLAGESSRMCACREVFEELGIIIAENELHKVMEFSFSENHVLFDVFYIVVDDEKINCKLQCDEVDEIMWADEKVIRELLIGHKFYDIGIMVAYHNIMQCLKCC